MALDNLQSDPKVNFKDKYEAELSDWIQLEKAAIALIHITGSLWFDKSVELVLIQKSTC